MAGDVVGGDVGCAGFLAAVIVVGMLGVPRGEAQHARVARGDGGRQSVGALMELTALHVGIG